MSIVSFKKDRNKVQVIYNDLDMAEQMMINRNSETKKIDIVRRLRKELQAQTQISPTRVKNCKDSK